MTLALITDLIKQTKIRGADEADAVLVKNMGISVARRLGQPETIERDESTGVGLRVFVGKKQAFASSTDITPSALTDLAERVVAMAKASPEDPYACLADKTIFATNFPELDLHDAEEPSAETLAMAAAKAEEAALAVAGVTNSEGADAHYGSFQLALATSKGFVGNYTTSNASLSVSVIAGSGTEMERDYDYTAVRHYSDLGNPAQVGTKAGERAVRRLNPKKVGSCEVPVVFDPRVARNLVSTFASAINGASIARKTSFLQGKLGQKIFSDAITIIDEPHRIRGLKSRPFDAEGVSGKRLALVEKGMLTTWLLDLRSANQLGMKTTGHASRGLSSPPTPSHTNLYIENGTLSPEALIADIKQGFYVTDTFGMGINTVTGDYSQGANGFWIENGKITYPVSEVTIAGRLQDMFLNLTPANDLVFKYGTDSPSLRVEKLMVAGV